MNFLDSIKWVLFSQEHYRLAVFRIDWNSSKLITEKYQFFYSFFVIALVACEFFFCGFLLVVEDFEMPAKQKVFAVILMLEFILTLICALYMLSNALIKRKLQIKFFEKVLDIDEVLRKEFEVQIDYKIFKRISVVSLVIIMLYYNVIIAGLMLSFKTSITLRVSSLYSYLIVIVYIVQSTGPAIFSHGYVGCVSLIYQRICAATGELEKIIEREREKVRGEKYLKHFELGIVCKLRNV